ncbi:hypothetical protein [Aureimonas phyllosphaerae]|uniref:Uncharacterized protein n=1 Tax=Aureimonas phyllosphaerae TaxID=1166078 RepID=A0A7W6FU91_9HYPH|nr:hypothetical protein [Aureimonas phyllosphaerae]MBB3935836.1 hypothetical protein [Aureimonas phyllosphaerae]MBB3959844.1 hypothetical protein [Aureimonas phyllosphaerae]SFF15704.1 hypothetical protein SAMN05216566_103376 [Aureimonas phyllosphaerae]
MKSTLSAALVLLGTLGAASAAMAATPMPRHHVQHTMATTAAPSKTSPVKVMSETPVKDPGLLGVLQASDGQIYSATVNDPRIHGLPQY